MLSRCYSKLNSEEKERESDLNNAKINRGCAGDCEVEKE